MLDTFGALFARHSDIKPQHLGGAVKIMDVYYRLFNSEQGWRLALWFSVLMNVNLAVLNLLPIPMLDGGHLLYYFIEILKGSPPAEWVVEWGQRAGVALLGLLTVLALYNDLIRLLS